MTFHCDREEFGMASISERESREIEAANASGTTPIVFIHGLWLLPSSWADWADFFKQAGYAPLTPDWPDDPETVEEARANPDVLAKKTLKQVADHTADVIGKLEKKPAVMGHWTGGLVAQMLAGRGLSAATVAIDPGVFRGVLPLPFSTLKASGPFLLNPRYRGRAITLTFEQFKYGGAIANASYNGQKRNQSVTEIKKMPNRGHSLTIDHGWREVAQTALDFVNR